MILSFCLDLDQYYLDSDDNSSSIEMPLIFYIPNDQWGLIGNPVFEIGKGSWHGHIFDEAKVTIRLKRRSKFYTVALISPFIVLYTLSGIFHSWVRISLSVLFPSRRTRPKWPLFIHWCSSHTLRASSNLSANGTRRKLPLSGQILDHCQTFLLSK